MNRTDLVTGWTLRAVGPDIPDLFRSKVVSAFVPGSVVTDLVENELMPDPYLGTNESLFGIVGQVDWCYETRFFADVGRDEEYVDLVCDGLDTIATVELNGSVVARTANMHRSYRFDVKGLLRNGENELRISFAAPLNYTEMASKSLGPRPHVNAHPYNAVRKMASSFGWDWGPDIPTAGIWRPIGIERWTKARICSIRPISHVDLDGSGSGVGTLRIHIDGEAESDELAILISASLKDPAGHVVSKVEAPWPVVNSEEGTAAPQLALGSSERVQMKGELCIEVDDVELWWPVGYGDQPLYELCVEARIGQFTKENESPVIDSVKNKVGFRHVTLETVEPDGKDCFRITVNNQVVVVRGVNWIPEDCFPHRVNTATYEKRLTDAVEANANLVRVWGGGIYESDAFYELCDSMGLMVWQDVLLACAAYAEEEPLAGEIIKEVTEAATRLCSHPSLVVWNGGNECIWGHEDWGWKDQLGDLTWGLEYYSTVLADVLARIDPGRAYVANSPFSTSPELHPNDPSTGTVHVWDVWNQLDYTSYRDHKPHFVAEFGFQGPPSWTTLVRAIGSSTFELGDPALLSHQKAEDGMAKLAAGLKGHLCPTSSTDDWHWARSLNQARAIAFGIEHWRSQVPRCMGTILWQLNDCWPVISWSVVDGDGRRKPAWYALRASYAERLLTIQPAGNDLMLIAVNDSQNLWEQTVQVTRQTFDATVLAATTLEVNVKPGQVQILCLPGDIAQPLDKKSELIVAGDMGNRCYWYFVEDLDLSLPPSELDVEVSAVPEGYLVVVTANSLQKDVALLCDKAVGGATVSDMLVTLLSGESTSFLVHTSEVVDPKRFTDGTVLRSANQLLDQQIVGEKSKGGSEQ